MRHTRIFCTGYRARQLQALQVLSAEPATTATLTARIEERGWGTPTSLPHTLALLVEHGYAALTTTPGPGNTRHAYALTRQGEQAADEAFELLGLDEAREQHGRSDAA